MSGFLPAANVKTTSSIHLPSHKADHANQIDYEEVILSPCLANRKD